jgi:16S rRNA (cytosine1402-N4)-methyltransferase
MMASRDSAGAVAGGLARHIPVLGRRTVEFLDVRAGGVYIDATFGAGGHSRAILAAADCKVIGIDRDHEAIARGADLVRAADGRLALVEDKFSDLEVAARGRGYEAVDGVVLDLGVSSCSSTRPRAAFPSATMVRSTCAWAVQVEPRPMSWHGVRARAYGHYGDARGRAPRARIARAIVAARRATPIRTTRALADIVAAVVHARAGAIHPATRTFQALRIFVNESLPSLPPVSPRRSGCSSPRTIGSAGVPFARRSDRQIISVERSRPALPRAIIRRRCRRP